MSENEEESRRSSRVQSRSDHAAQQTTEIGTGGFCRGDFARQGRVPRASSCAKRRYILSRVFGAVFGASASERARLR